MSHDLSVTPRRAYATFCTDDFVPGVLALATSLRRHRNAQPLIVMHLGDLTDSSRKALATVPDLRLREVAPIKNPHASADPRFSVVFAKLHVFGLTEFERVVFIDADALVLANIDDLLELDSTFAAAPDHGIGLRKNEFNSGVFVCRPDERLQEELLAQVTLLDSRDGGDQGFLNSYFGTQTTRLARSDNTLKRIYWHHPHMFDQKQVRILHFVGDKPWHTPPKDFARYHPLYELWWRYYPSDLMPIPRHIPTPDEASMIRWHQRIRHARGFLARMTRLHHTAAIGRSSG